MKKRNDMKTNCCETHINSSATCCSNHTEKSTCCSTDIETRSDTDGESSSQRSDGRSEEDESASSTCCSGEEVEPEQTACCSNEKTESANSICCSSKKAELEQGARCSNEETKTEQITCCSSEEVETEPHTSCSSKNAKPESSTCCTSEKVELEQVTCCSHEQTDAKQSSCCSNDKLKLEHATCCSNEIAKKSPCSNEEPEQDSCCSDDSQNKSNSCCHDTSEQQEPDQQVKTNSENEKTLEFKVKGMDCPSCASTIEKALTRFKTLTDVHISYATEKLQVATDGDVTLPQIEKTINNLGFTLEPLHPVTERSMAIYQVNGMDCGSCAKTIEKHLINLAGVEEVNVNFSTGQMKVAHSIPAEQIIKQTSKLGFDAELIDRKQNKRKKRNLSQINSIIVSGIFIATGFIGSYTGMPEWISTLLFAVAIVLSGLMPIKSAYYALKSRSLDMNVLMSSAAIGAAIIGEWFEGATVVWLFSFGIFLQDKSMEKTRKSIRDLMDIAPPEAWISTPRGLIKKSVEDVAIGDTVVIKPGDKIPLDGEIVEGETSINQAPITGESIPVDKTVGDYVYAGTINESGALEVKVTKLVEDTTLAKIIHLVEEAQEQRAPTQAFIDKFSNIYTPIVFVIALSVIIFPPLLGIGDWSEWVYKGLALLVIACPCALVISTPVAIVSAIGNAAKHGVLIKEGNFLEAAGAINAIAFDKTGTLTEGKPQVSDIQALNASESNLLSMALTLESHSTHPIAKTIVKHAKDKGVVAHPGAQYKNIPGKGVEAIIDDTKYYAGNPKLFKELGILTDTKQYNISTWQEQGKTIIIIGTKSTILGIITVTDTIRNTTKKSLQGLPKLGIKQIVMLTGDNEGTAKLISEQTSVNRYFAELLPEEKVEALEKLQHEGYNIAMVGDGINDAPALATSNLGIAMGASGTDAAMETADIVLMQDNLEKLPYTVRLSKRTIRIIKQNIWFSLIIKFIALALIFPGWLTLWMAVLSDTGAAIIVILNALRLLRVKE